MKPIILVILGAAMLMPMMHHRNIHYSKELRKSRTRRLEQLQLKQDSETDVHNISFWMERIP